MTGTATVTGVSMLAHGLHSLVVLLGLWGLAALLLPHLLERRGARLTSDPHTRRVAELRTALTHDARTVAVPVGGPVAWRSSHDPRPSSPSPAPRAPALGLPLALVAATAAAGIHLAVARAHLAEEPLSAIALLLAGLAQLCWVASLVSRPSLATVRLGLVLHGGLVALWAWTRLAGLPFGLLAERHPVGGWDVACVLWELVCLAVSVRLLQGRSTPVLPGWFDWHPSSRFAVGAAVVATAMLTLTGAHS